MDYDSSIPQNEYRPIFNDILVNFTYSIGMIASKIFYDICFMVFYPTALATVYGQRPKFFRAEHSAMAEGQNSGYGPTLMYILSVYT